MPHERNNTVMDSASSEASSQLEYNQTMEEMCAEFPKILQVVKDLNAGKIPIHKATQQITALIKKEVSS